MSFTMLATFVPRPGADDELLAALQGMVEPSLAEPGCLEYRPLTDPARPGVVVMVERWRDQTALDEHFASPHFADVAPRLAALLGEAIAITDLEPRDGREEQALVAPEALRTFAAPAG
jgi:quinol monooxygenase YgiN